MPFTIGLLIGIGEWREGRAESLIALHDVHERHGLVQEVIIQNFHAKSATSLRGVDDANCDEYLAEVATARVVLGPDMCIEATPILSDPRSSRRWLRPATTTGAV